MEKTTVNLTSRYRLVAYDERNWTLERYDEPKANNPRLNEGGAKWRRTGNYFKNLGVALAHVFERLLREGGGEYDAEGIVERAVAIRDELMGVRA